jgi:hypothetical protein
MLSPYLPASIEEAEISTQTLRNKKQTCYTIATLGLTVCHLGHVRGMFPCDVHFVSRFANDRPASQILCVRLMRVDLEYFCACVCVCVSLPLQLETCSFLLPSEWGKCKGGGVSVLLRLRGSCLKTVTRQSRTVLNERFRFGGHCYWLLFLKLECTFSGDFACCLLHADVFLGILFDP